MAELIRHCGIVTCTYPIGFAAGLVFRLGLAIFIERHQLNVSPIAPRSIYVFTANISMMELNILFQYKITTTPPIDQ